MISVVIPAHNEESVIARGLRAILTGAASGELEVIVSCNGCTDRTAEIARSFGPPVRVIELAQASKIAALNAADEVATGFPRFYIDADVVVNLASLRAMARVLERGEALLVAPRLEMDLSRTSWAVRSWYRVWMSLPYNQFMVGTGAYGLSREGRARFGKFPDLIADDGFVRFSFAPQERVRVTEAVSHVDPPRTLGALIRIKTRSRRGFYQHFRARRLCVGYTGERVMSIIATLCRYPCVWLFLPWYVVVSLVIRLRAWAQCVASRSALVWEVDDTRAGVGVSYGHGMQSTYYQQSR